MFKKKSDNDKLAALLDCIRKEAFDAGFSYGWDAAMKAVIDKARKQETENELQWVDMRNGKVYPETETD